MKKVPPKKRTAPVWIFVGPSLSPQAVKKVFPRAAIAPPAAQGDIWKAIDQSPSAIILLDGVFESSPSVWHHELLAAIRAGIPVFGGASMGALRAAELHRFGMIGAGRIFEAFRDGTLVDDAEVAVLHAAADAAHRTLTVPLVNIRFTAEEALREGVLSRPRANELVSRSSEIFYQERYWPTVLRALRSGWNAATFEAFQTWVGPGPKDLKAQDAIETLRTAKTWLSENASQMSPPVRTARGSSLVRRRRNAGKHWDIENLSSEATADGTRRLLLARMARSLGISPPAEHVERLKERFEKMSSRWKLGADERKRIIEDLALDAWLVSEAPRWLQDGPSLEEGGFIGAGLSLFPNCP